jgi:hypothetical protein
MDLWSAAEEREWDFRDADDDDRLEMAALRHEAARYKETDPEHAVALYARGRQLAEQLGEPWWAFLYQVWQCLATIHYADDYVRGLDLAVACVLKARDAAYRDHPWRVAPFNCLLECYISIDPLGYATEIRQTLDFTESIVPRRPYDDLLVMLSHKWDFLAAQERWDEARAAALEHMAVKEADHQRVSFYYDLAPAGFLCWLSARLEDWAAVQRYAALVEESAIRCPHAEEELSEAALWQAAAARQAGDEASASRRYRSGTGRMGRLNIVPQADYFDALALFHELGGNFAQALRVRERELEALQGRGQNVHECATHLKRCKLLARLGKLKDNHVAAARQAIARMRRPDKYLADLAAACAPETPR